MHPYPHVYRVTARGNPAGSVAVWSSQLPDLETAPPPEFDGPGGVWSPEGVLCAAVSVRTTVEDALSRCSERITRVAVHLANENAPAPLAE